MNSTTAVSTETFVPHEIEIHYKRPVFDTMTHITDADSAHQCFRAFINKHRIDHKEFFWLIVLNCSNRVLGIAEIASGSGNSVAVDFREIFQIALLTNAKGLLVGHCHPSGNLTISESDRNMTLKLRNAAHLMHMTLIDHLIITSESFTSFANEGEL